MESLPFQIPPIVPALSTASDVGQPSPQALSRSPLSLLAPLAVGKGVAVPVGFAERTSTGPS